MNATQRVWAIAIGSAVAGAVLVGGAVYYAMSGEIERLESKLDLMESADGTPTAGVALDAAEPEPSSTVAPETDAQPKDSGADSQDVAPGGSGSPQAASEDGRQFCYITDATWEGALAELKVDYAQMLTGAAAAAAAAAAGDESPPPNDYYIVNANPKLRTLPADTTMTVRMTSTSEGARPEGYDMSFGQWFDAYSGMSGTFPGIEDLPYWVTIKNGTVIKIEEQFLP